MGRIVQNTLIITCDRCEARDTAEYDDAITVNVSDCGDSVALLDGVAWLPEGWTQPADEILCPRCGERGEAPDLLPEGTTFCPTCQQLARIDGDFFLPISLSEEHLHLIGSCVEWCRSEGHIADDQAAKLLSGLLHIVADALEHVEAASTATDRQPSEPPVE